MRYDRPIWSLMHDAAADLEPPWTVADFIAWFGEHYPDVKPASVRAHVSAMTANDPNRRHHPHVGSMTALFERLPDRTLMPFDPETSTIVDDGEVEDDPVVGDGAVSEQSAEFVLEAHLEDFLLGNWQSIGWGRPLKLWQGPNGESGHQFSTPVGRLDFLCVDQSNGALVVVELKRGRPSDKVVGQIMRYIGYLQVNIAAPGQSVDGLIIGHDADDPLRYAVSAMPTISLMTYQVTFNLSSVDIPSNQNR